MSKESISIQASSFSRTLFAYISILKQLSAKYNNSTLRDSCQELNSIYVNLSSIEVFDNEAVESIEQGAFLLKLCIINVHIAILKNQFLDLEPICNYLEDLSKQIFQTIES